MTKRWSRAVALVAATLMTVMVAAAPQAVAAAGTKQERCLAKAARAVGHAIDPADYAMQLGTSSRDHFTATAEQDLICGFGGADRIKPGTPPLAAGDIFMGGPGNDFVKHLDGGLVIGGRGHDWVKRQISGTFIGGDGRDFVSRLQGGAFRGERGSDAVFDLIGGLFAGGGLNDFVFIMEAGTFRGGVGDDFVETMMDGVYDGGAGSDTILEFLGGTLISVEACFSCPGPLGQPTTLPSSATLMR